MQVFIGYDFDNIQHLINGLAMLLKSLKLGPSFWDKITKTSGLPGSPLLLTPPVALKQVTGPHPVRRSARLGLFLSLIQALPWKKKNRSAGHGQGYSLWERAVLKNPFFRLDTGLRRLI